MTQESVTLPRKGYEESYMEGKARSIIAKAKGEVK